MLCVYSSTHTCYHDYFPILSGKERWRPIHCVWLTRQDSKIVGCIHRCLHLYLGEETCTYWDTLRNSAFVFRHNLLSSIISNNAPIQFSCLKDLLLSCRWAMIIGWEQFYFILEGRPLSLPRMIRQFGYGTSKTNDVPRRWWLMSILWHPWVGQEMFLFSSIITCLPRSARQNSTYGMN